MPIYEYSCRKCGKIIERIQKFSDPPLRKHPGCGGTLTKLISQSAFQLKGSGWYVTDYAKRDRAPEGSASDTSSAQTGDKKDQPEKATKETKKVTEDKSGSDR